MPKKKKKEKTSAEDPATQAESTSISSSSSSTAVTTSTVPRVPSGGTRSVQVRDPFAMLQHRPQVNHLAMKNPMKMIKEVDPNIKLLGQSELAEMEQALQDHIKEDVIGGGMNVFAINKDGISRAVVKFMARPEPKPLTISFHFPGTFLTHRYVMAIMKGAVASIEGADVTEVRYVDRNVRLGTRGLENRWLVTLNDMRAKQLLMLKGIKVVNRTIYVKSYDEVVNDEYREYQRYADIQTRMKMGYGAKNKSTFGSDDNPEEVGDGSTPLPAGEKEEEEDGDSDDSDSEG